MPEGIAATMSPRERRDLVRFLMELGKAGETRRHSCATTRMGPRRSRSIAAVHPERWPNWRQPVNRERIYDFYAKEAEYFRKQSPVPFLLPPFPGLDGGIHGHWGNQNEKSWADAPLEPDGARLGPLRRLSRRRSDRAQGRLRPARRSQEMSPASTPRRSRTRPSGATVSCSSRQPGTDSWTA